MKILLVDDSPTIRAATAQVPHEHSEIAAHVTLSVGVAGLLPGMDVEPERLIAAADQALYQAKKLGRNRVVTLQAESA